MFHDHGSRQARGMTMLEVTAVLTSLFLASALLVPSSGELRRQSKEVRCLSNVGRIARASLMYAAADADELAIPVHPRFASPLGGLGAYG